MFGFPLSLLPGFSLLLILVGGQALAAQCPPPAMPLSLKVSTLATAMAPPSVENTRSKAEITALSGRSPMAGGPVTLGLTRSTTEVQITPSVWDVDLGDGRHCVGLTRVDATWRIAVLSVDISAEYAPGTCHYRVVREHEEEHVTIARAVFQAWAPRMEAALHQSAERIAPEVSGGGGKAFAKQVIDRIMADLQPMMAAYRADLVSRNAAIDTPASYRATGARCRNW
ncbi:conserved exported hypothetical protein [Candidatus Terasakiella magnetica]|nr:conserved exported hypothetical protein [Candidatus Terasakiella magnetica]